MQADVISRAFEESWTRAQLELRYLGIGPDAVHHFQDLLGHLLYPNARLRPSSERLERNRLGQGGLWGLGISGDLPIVCVLVPDGRSLALVREVLLAHTYWRLQGFRADALILNQEAASYDKPLNQQLMRVVQAHSLHTAIDAPGGVYVRDWNILDEGQRALVLAASHVVLNGNRGRLAKQLATLGDTSAAILPSPATWETLEPEATRPLPFLELEYFNGLGGFSKDGREYCVYLAPGDSCPRPWANVMAGPEFGTLVTEAGLGFTWFGNSQANRLTPWSNDPVSDGPSEAIYLRDDETGEAWSPTASPARSTSAYRARHGWGYSVFEHNHHGIDQELLVFVPRNGNKVDPVKLCRLRVRNDSSRDRKLSLFWYADWVLGTNREDTQLHVQTSYGRGAGVLLAKNPWNGNYAERVAFLSLSKQPDSWSGDRTAFLGRNGLYRSPSGLGRMALDNRTGAGLDPAGILQSAIELKAGEEIVVTCMIGSAANAEEAHEIAGRYKDRFRLEEALRETQEWWKRRLSTIQVTTPVESVNLLLNGWLVYQTLSCRFWARSAMYQSGGAFGFRDQLQDSMALIYCAPEITREHILRSAARQFPEGDVQHWWHVETGMGVRTRCSDDLLWLPFVTAQYISITGDTGILDTQIEFITGPELGPDEHEHLFTPQIDTKAASLLEHCLRALNKADTRGAHGLPLMGNGDWNDGMNHVGPEGKGESVWLGWFLAYTQRKFADLLDRLNRGGDAGRYRDRANEIVRSIESSCWDGEWYLRAFFDDGSPLGSKANDEAKIDSLPQSWAVMAGGDKARARQATDSAMHLLLREKDGLVQLFTPPFDRSTPHPGYIMGYPPGLRENGGQYTHGSIWLAQAMALRGSGDEAVKLLQVMNPIERCRDPKGAALYGCEPYVVAADVYSAPGSEGRAGWSWYTGSASWMYRVWLESVLGFTLLGDRLELQPSIPAAWPGFSISYLHGEGSYDIQVKRGGDSGVHLDGRRLDSAAVPLSRAPGRHLVEVFL